VLATSGSPYAGDLLSLTGSRKRGPGTKGKDAKGQASGSCPVNLDRNSFDGDTPVLLGDGSRKAIKDLRAGDQVTATDPTTGETSVKTVTDTRSHAAERLLYEITVVTDTGSGTVIATDEHPFWVESLRKWVSAEDLHPGYTFETADHRPATVGGKRAFSSQRQVYNLTVDGHHTYYVLAGEAPVLVHNEDPSECGELITIYRGTKNGRENELFDQTGFLMSDVGGDGYRLAKSTKKSRAITSEAHARNVEHFGSEQAYVVAHGVNQEKAPAGRTLISFTTDLARAEYFADGGSIFSAQVRRSEVLFQTLSTSTESEVLVRGRIRASRL